MVVTAVEGMVAKIVEESITVVGAALSRRKQFKAEAIAHRCRKSAGVEVEVKEWGGRCIDPVASVDLSERE